jgi:predicted nucleic-acid-binding protein
VIGLGANALVRHLVQDDDADQHAAAEELLSAATVDGPAFASLTTLVETVWALRLGYKFPAPEALGLIEALLHTPQIVLEDA